MDTEEKSYCITYEARQASGSISKPKWRLEAKWNFNYGRSTIVKAGLIDDMEAAKSCNTELATPSEISKGRFIIPWCLQCAKYTPVRWQWIGFRNMVTVSWGHYEPGTDTEASDEALSSGLYGLRRILLEVSVSLASLCLSGRRLRKIQQHCESRRYRKNSFRNEGLWTNGAWRFEGAFDHILVIIKILAAYLSLACISGGQLSQANYMMAFRCY